MGAVIPNKAACRSAMLKSIADLEARMARNIEVLVREVDEHIKSLTPVHTGQAVRNYIWTTGAPSTTVFEAIDNGPPGPTNSMSLGQEPRRDVNETAAAQSLESLNFANPFTTIYLTNNSPDIVGLELGRLPFPGRSRSPRGMFGLVNTYVQAKIAAKGIMS